MRIAQGGKLSVYCTIGFIIVTSKMHSYDRMDIFSQGCEITTCHSTKDSLPSHSCIFVISKTLTLCPHACKLLALGCKPNNRREEDKSLKNRGKKTKQKNTTSTISCLLRELQSTVTQSFPNVLMSGPNL